MEEMERVRTAEEVAEILRLSVYTVHELLRDGKLPGFKIRSRWRVNDADLREFMKTHGKGEINDG